MKSNGRITFEKLPEAMEMLLGEFKSLREEVSTLNETCKGLSERKKPSDVEVMNVRQICDFLMCSKWSIYNWVENGDLPYFKVGRRLFFNVDDVVQWRYQLRRKTLLEKHEMIDGHMQSLRLTKDGINDNV